MAGLTVAVTGPTGELGRSFVRALERSRDIGRIVGMARRPFDPAAHGWKRTEYRRGDVLDRARSRSSSPGADVVVHLAFVVVKASDETRHVNVEGSRNVFEATVASGARRLVYASSVAAYGFPEDLDGPLTEDMPALGHARHPYSAHKAEVEAVLADALAGGRHRPVGLPPLHRRRPRRPRADRAGALARSPPRPAGRAGGRRRCPARPGRELPARPPRRRRPRAARRRPRPRRARRLQPRRRRRDHHARPRPGARPADRADAQARARGPRPSSSPGCHSCPRRRRGSRPCAGRC